MGKSTIADIRDLRLSEDIPNVLAEMGLLHLHRPTANASPAVVAAWHREHAVVLDHLGRDADAVTARAHADQLDHGDGLAVAA